MARGRRARSPWWVLLIVFLLGGLLGSVIAEALGGYPALAFLAQDVRAGVDPPVTLDLRIITLTLGGMIRLNLAILGGILFAIWLLRLLV